MIPGETAAVGVTKEQSQVLLKTVMKESVQPYSFPSVNIKNVVKLIILTIGLGDCPVRDKDSLQDAHTHTHARAHTHTHTHVQSFPRKH